jgi:hypothetical protein
LIAGLPFRAEGRAVLKEETSMYEIVDRHTGKVVAIVKTRRGASLAVDRRDNAYGAYRYFARLVMETAR